MPAISALAELVIPGLQAIGWLYLIGCLVLGWQWLSPVDDKLPSQIVLVVVGALAYTLGDAVDRVADSLLTAIMDRIKPPPPGRRAELVKMRVRVHGQGGDISEHLQYVRSRLRIARSTILNLAVA